MDEVDVYLYGMSVLTTMHLLKGEFPELDGYAEVSETYHFPGGETGNSATVLSNYGCSVKIDGPYLGKNTKELILAFFNNINVDTSGMYYDDTFDGVEDLVIIDKATRTVFGKFGAYFSDPIHKRRWSVPSKEDIAAAKVVGIDPFFYEESVLAARYCKELGKKYVVIDCKPDSEMHNFASATVISNEFIRNEFGKEDREALFKRYTDSSDGLVIFTCGSKKIYYGRKNQSVNKIEPYRVEVKSTLGAGDTFKAGVIYGLLKEMSDEKIVQFASATAGVVCSHFPLALNPPNLNQVFSLIQSQLK